MMSNKISCPRRLHLCAARLVTCIVVTVSVQAHIIPPENFHPAVESYRRMNFLLNLNPIPWHDVLKDTTVITKHAAAIVPAAAKEFHDQVSRLIEPFTKAANGNREMPDSAARRQTARAVFESSTRIMARLLKSRLEVAAAAIREGGDGAECLKTARKLWAAFEYEIQHSDSAAHTRLGIAWLELSTARGSRGIMKAGEVPAKVDLFTAFTGEIIGYLDANFGDHYQTPGNRRLAPLPTKSPTFDAAANVFVKLPPGHNINKQVPRPRQILNMAARGVDEGETALIAVGDMAFDSAYIFGEPMRSFQMSCNTCHNKSITNPQFFIPGLSHQKGAVDISNNFLAPHANNGLFDSLDIPDLRGIKFTAPYGRNGRFPSLREFVRNGIMNEFNGPEPDPVLVDGILAYMNEFDFLPNPALDRDGTLNDNASSAARRGEKLFRKPFTTMDRMSCATCHIPSANFIDHKRHDIGTVEGAEPFSRDRALDTPTLLGIKFTAPYFHDGRAPTLQAVVEWFNDNHGLGMKRREIDDLTAYLDTVGDGVDAYEDTSYYLDAEMEEFSFFLSAYEFLKEKDKPKLMTITFETIASEIRNHKWELQDYQFLPVMNRLAELMDEAVEANKQGNRALVDQKVEAYRMLFAENVDDLK